MMSFDTVSRRRALDMAKEEYLRLREIGELYYSQGNLEKAKLIFEGAVALEPEDSMALSAAGALYTRMRHDDEALEHLNKAISINPKLISAYVNRAEVKLRKTDLKGVVNDLVQAIELDKDIKDTSANRARIMLAGIFDVMKTKGLIKTTT